VLLKEQILCFKNINSLTLNTQKLYKKIFCIVRAGNLSHHNHVQKLGFIEEFFFVNNFLTNNEQRLKFVPGQHMSRSRSLENGPLY